MFLEVGSDLQKRTCKCSRAFSGIGFGGVGVVYHKGLHCITSLYWWFILSIHTSKPCLDIDTFSSRSSGQVKVLNWSARPEAAGLVNKYPHCLIWAP